MIRLGIICPSEIALRRFMPALCNLKEFKFVGIGVCNSGDRFGNENMTSEELHRAREHSHERALAFVEQYGGKIFDSYEEIITSGEIDAIYLPLPPALHYPWAYMALENHLHVLVEKPLTTSLSDTKKLVRFARDKKLALHENYMFVYHEQLKAINQLVKNGGIGQVRLYRISFGFPRRAETDFRYDRKLGGGALIDAGGYVLKLASMLLGSSASIKAAQMNYLDSFNVDIYGSATVVNDAGMTAQVAFGMDNSYKCDLEIWGSKGCLTTRRILTAPSGFTPVAEIKTGDGDKTIVLPSDDAFRKSIKVFHECMYSEECRRANYQGMIRQAELISEFYHVAKNSF